MPRTHIETTAGAIPAEQLGRTLVHEHLKTTTTLVRDEWPHLERDPTAEFARAVGALDAVKAHGVATWCDPACMNLGRDAAFATRAAERAGVHVVLATGAYVYETLPCYFRNRGKTALADCFVRDAEIGIQGTPVKAAFLKCAVDEHGITPDVAAVLRAVADAHHRTGLPIMSHCRLSGVALGPDGPIPPSDEERRRALEITMRQLDILLDEAGVAPAAVQLAHVGDCGELDTIERVLERGTFIGMDRYGLDFINTSAERNRVVATLCRRGYAERMMLGHDSCATIDWYPAGMVDQLAPRWRPTLLFEEELPALRDLGVTDAQVETMLVHAPRRWLTA
jgi:phosphotriesterase-related protein